MFLNPRFRKRICPAGKLMIPKSANIGRSRSRPPPSRKRWFKSDAFFGARAGLRDILEQNFGATAAPMGFGYVDAQQVRVGQGLPQGIVHAAQGGVAFEFGQALGRAGVGEDLPGEFSDGVLFFGGRKVHALSSMAWWFLGG